MSNPDTLRNRRPDDGPNLAPVRTDVHSRMDRLPWSRFHWLVVGALGASWAIDGLEVTLAGAVGAALQASDSLGLSSARVGATASAYLLGAVIGALVCGYLTDRHGRKKLFFVTLAIYLARHAADGVRLGFLELRRVSPDHRLRYRRRVRGDQFRDRRADSRAGSRPHESLHQRQLLDRCGGRRGSRPSSCSILRDSPRTSAGAWGSASARCSGLLVLLARRHVPESPRWLVVHGHEARALAVVCGTRGSHGAAGPRVRRPRPIT